MKDKIISFVIGCLVGGAIVFGYSHYFGNTNSGFSTGPGGQRPNFNHQRSGSGETTKTNSNSTTNTTTPTTTTTK